MSILMSAAEMPRAKNLVLHIGMILSNCYITIIIQRRAQEKGKIISTTHRLYL